MISKPTKKSKSTTRVFRSNSKQGVYDLLVSYRSGDMWAPKIEQTEALKAELGYFVDCIKKGETPLMTDWRACGSCGCSRPPRSP